MSSTQAITPSLPTEGSLSPFPPEVMDMVLDHLSRDTVLALLRVNSAFHTVVKARLRPQLVIEEFDNQLQLTAHSLDASSPSLTSTWLPEFVQCVDVYPHTAASCSKHTKLLDLPNAKVLRLHLGTGTRRALHTDTPNEAVSMDAAGANPCPLLTDFAPRSLVVIDPPARGELPALLPLELTARLQRQVYVLGPGVVGPQGTVNHTIFVNRYHLPAVRDITILFYAPRGTTWLPLPSGRIEEGFDLPSWFERQLRSLMLGFMHVLLSAFRKGQLQPRSLTIVNAGAIDPRAIDYGYDYESEEEARADRQSHVEFIFRQHIWRSTVPPGIENTLGISAKQLRDAVRFLSVQEWVAEGGAEGVLDSDQLREMRGPDERW